MYNHLCSNILYLYRYLLESFVLGYSRMLCVIYCYLFLIFVFSSYPLIKCLECYDKVLLLVLDHWTLYNIKILKNKTKQIN